MMTNKRPFFLNLVVIALPIGGWVSILHRASGAALSLAVPILLWLAARSLASPEGYQEVRGLLGGVVGVLFTVVVAWATLHHLVAGLRHLGFDIGLGEQKETARRSAWATLAIGLAGTALVAMAVLP
jgi:succinate dehydrogenase / fumarate reductase cytochrome b subunit